MQRLKTRAQYEAAMAGGTVSRTPHFVLHRAPLAAPSAGPRPAPKPPGTEAAVSVAAEGRRSARGAALFAVTDQPWVGVVVPKRWAKRAVTRNGIRRQVYAVSEAFASRLPAAAHVVRLRTEFARKDFTSAWSEALRVAVRGELLQLFERATSAVPAPPTVIPAQAGIQEGR